MAGAPNLDGLVHALIALCILCMSLGVAIFKVAELIYNHFSITFN